MLFIRIQSFTVGTRVPRKASARSIVNSRLWSAVHIKIAPTPKKHVVGVSNQNKNLAGRGFLFIPHIRNTNIGIIVAASTHINRIGVLKAANILKAILASSISINTNNGDMASPLNIIRKRKNRQ